VAISSKRVIWGAVFISLCLLLSACGVAAKGSTQSANKNKLPYPLNIPVKDRSKPQIAQSRLMLLAAYSNHDSLRLLPPDLAGKIKVPSQIAQVRLSLTVPTLTYTTDTSWNTTIVAVYSTTPSGNSYRVAMLGGTTCMELSYAPHRAVQYGETTLTGLSHKDIVNGCIVTTLPASGWHSTWTSITGSHPPTHPLPIPSLPPLPPLPKAS